MTTGMGGDAGRTLNGEQQGERIQNAASGLMDQAARTAEAQASTTMTKVGDTLDQVASAIREAGSGLRDSQPEIAGFVDTAAERVSDASMYLRDHDAREALDNVQRFAREQPAVVIGGGLALGLLLGRFLRSGASGQQQAMQPYGAYGTGYNPDQYGTGGYVGGSTGYGTAGTSYGAGTTGYAAGSTGYESTGAAAAGGMATTNTGGDLGGPFATGASGVGSDLGSTSDVGVSDDFSTTDTTAVGTDEMLGDETRDVERER